MVTPLRTAEITGLLLVFVGWFKSLTDGRGQQPRWRRRSRALAGLPSGMLALIMLTGCGNRITTEINGAVAVRTNPDGSLVFVLNVCSDAVDEVLLFGPSTGPKTEPEKPLGIWQAPTPVEQDTVINLNSPEPEWEVRREPGPLQPETTYSAFGDYREQDLQLSQVDFTATQLKRLRPSQVLWKNGRVIQETKFNRQAPESHINTEACKA